MHFNLKKKTPMRCPTNKHQRRTWLALQRYRSKRFPPPRAFKHQGLASHRGWCAPPGLKDRRRPAALILPVLVGGTHAQRDRGAGHLLSAHVQRLTSGKTSPKCTELVVTAAGQTRTPTSFLIHSEKCVSMGPWVVGGCVPCLSMQPLGAAPARSKALIRYTNTTDPIFRSIRQPQTECTALCGGTNVHIRRAQPPPMQPGPLLPRV